MTGYSHWVPIFNTTGLLLNLAGVILLFRFAMPFKNRTNGEVNYIGENPDLAELAKEQLHDRISYFGIGVVSVGTLLQVVAAWL